MKAKLFFVMIIILLLSMFYNCGKKDDGTKSNDGKETKNGSKNDESLSFDKPISVEFKVGGSINGTVSAIYYQKKARSTSNFETAGMKMSATAYFDGGDYMYIVSEIAGQKMGMKTKKGDYGNKEGEIDALTFKDQLKNMDKIGTEEILGKKCDIYKSKDGKYQMSIYKEMVPLKISSGEGKMVMEATKFETDVKIDDNTFTPPQDIKYMDTGDLMKDMKNPKDMKNKIKGMEDMYKDLKK